jgi:hypothetical protein
LFIFFHLLLLLLRTPPLKITESRIKMAATAEYTDLHELAKGWKAAIARATDPATK